MIRIEHLTLDVAYDDATQKPPREWDWSHLLKVGLGDSNPPVATVTMPESDPRETAAVLAGLRTLQSDRHRARELEDVLSNCGEFEPLSNDEIDSLCEAITSGGGA